MQFLPAKLLRLAILIFCCRTLN